MTYDEVSDALLDAVDDWKHVAISTRSAHIEDCEVFEFSNGDQSLGYHFGLPTGLVVAITGGGERRAFHVPFDDITGIAAA